MSDQVEPAKVTAQIDLSLAGVGEPEPNDQPESEEDSTRE
jgi:hypothetical protein